MPLNEWRETLQTIDKLGSREIIQVVWDISNPKTLAREQRALQQAEKELGFSGRMITARDYLGENAKADFLVVSNIYIRI